MVSPLVLPSVAGSRLHAQALVHFWWQADGTSPGLQEKGHGSFCTRAQPHPGHCHRVLSGFLLLWEPLRSVAQLWPCLREHLVVRQTWADVWRDRAAAEAVGGAVRAFAGGPWLWMGHQ